MNTFDWLSMRSIRDVRDQDFVEVSFSHGKRKEFFFCAPELTVNTGDMVVTEAEGGGTDIGQVSLSGELVLLQMKRRKVNINQVALDVVRRAHQRDLERLREARELEKHALVRGRVIAYATELPIKLSDVEYQADLRKATFYFTSENRVDFRELIKSLSREFKVRVELRQLSARQEAGRIGGIGSCGRELCCSTWLTDFQKVNTTAARYQGLSLNQAKLSGQCGRLKCCLNYELDTYLDALEEFPKKADKLRLPSGKAVLVKTDVFKGLMTYQLIMGKDRGGYVTLSVAQVHEIQNNPEMDVQDLIAIEKAREEELAQQQADEFDYEDVTGVIDIPVERRRKKKRKARPARKNEGKPEVSARTKEPKTSPAKEKSPEQSEKGRSGRKPDKQRQGHSPKSEARGQQQTPGATPRPGDETAKEPGKSGRNRRRPSRGGSKSGAKPVEGQAGNSPQPPRDPNAPAKKRDRNRNRRKPKGPQPD